MKYLGLICILLWFSGCKQKAKDGEAAKQETRTSGSVKILVDDTYSNIVDEQLVVFNSDYPDAKVELIKGQEQRILPTFLNDSVRVIVMSRVLTPKEEEFYTKRGIVAYTQRFAIDGVALIANSSNPDSTVTADEMIAILEGSYTGNKKLVFDNPYSSTVAYFKDLAKIKTLPSKGVYTLQSNADVIKYVAENKDYIGVIGLNWYLQAGKTGESDYAKVKLMGVKNVKGGKGDDAFYKPTQDNLISGIYPFLRNIYIINCEGKDGVGTGFANWLASPRGQLIILKSGLGPHKLISRDFNLKNSN
ncbi:phosphate ABC transporter substrate-binding protein [Pedobacter quisquiliarum]|uniref:Phosphate ABC transporter substrate-binding protein n=1 Tax=Pedobacter quisquiliarum TaxID=1834438 RepID=A0A916U820_9SPHI|nr:substrate-binding domain-containing protein [Pedobacter quisquiliarum]GGC63763.1 phosphate ABC transporter substrate-binding protein [Pedobacter quisquiliarum]